MISSTFSFGVFKESFQTEFLKLLGKFTDDIKIIFPNYLSSYITQLFPPSFCQEQSAEITSIYSLKKLSSDATVVYITPPESDLVLHFIQHFSDFKKANKVIFSIPTTNVFIENIIKNNGYDVVYDAISQPEKQVLIENFHSDFVPVEDDFFLLPSRNTFSKIFFDGEEEILYSSARALAKIQSIFGKIPHIMTIGEKSSITNDIMVSILNKTQIPQQVPVIDSLLIIDRMADIVTPLFIITTIEGMLDEVFGIHYGALLNPTTNETLLMTNKSPVFASYRDNSISNPDIDIVKELKSATEDLKTLQPNGLNMQEFSEKIKRINRIKPYKELIDKHINLLGKAYAEKGKDSTNTAIVQAQFDLLTGQSCSALAEQLVALKNDWRSAMKLLILEPCFNITHNKKFYQTIQNMCIAQFGSKAIKPLLNLDRNGLFSRDNRFPADWKIVQDNLTVTEKPKVVGDKNVYKSNLMNILDGYVPISVRLVQHCISNSSKVIQAVSQNKNMQISVTTAPNANVTKQKRKVLVFFVGGVTLTECSMIRNLSTESLQFLIGSTEQINSETFLDQLCPFLIHE